MSKPTPPVCSMGIPGKVPYYTSTVIKLKPKPLVCSMGSLGNREGTVQPPDCSMGNSGKSEPNLINCSSRIDNVLTSEDSAINVEFVPHLEAGVVASDCFSKDSSSFDCLPVTCEPSPGEICCLSRDISLVTTGNSINVDVVPSSESEVVASNPRFRDIPVVNHSPVMCVTDSGSLSSHSVDMFAHTGNPCDFNLPGSHSQGFPIKIDDWTSHDWILAHDLVYNSKLPNAFGNKITIPTSLNLPWLHERLKDFEDKQVFEFFKYGWPVGAIGLISQSQECFPRNHNSALDHPGDIDKFIRKGLDSHSIIGPFDSNPFNCPIGVSPLGTVEKSDSVDRRVILDMSWPNSSSVNDLIPKKEFLGKKCDLRYPGVDDLVKIIKSKGRGCALFKRDLKSAYRQLLRVDPGDIHLLGFSWKGKLYFDLTQPQGSRSAAMQCQRSTSALKFIFCSHSSDYSLVNYLDDFGSAEVWENAAAAYSFLGLLLKHGGILEAFAKSCGPSTKMVFLGVGFDTDKMILFITESRLRDLKVDLSIWLLKIRASKREIQSLTGKLNFVAACVPSSRIFLARMFAQLKSLSDNGSHNLNPEFKLDVRWWSRFISVYNGVSMMLLEEWSAPDDILSTDACLVGGGGWFGSIRGYFHTRFPSSIKSRFCSPHHISQLEMLTVVLASKVWCQLLAGKRIIILCDNESSVAAINHHRAKDEFLQLCARELALVCSTHDFQIRSEHISGVDNRIPDFLSRWDLDNSFSEKFFHEIGDGDSFEYCIDDDMFDFCADW